MKKIIETKKIEYIIAIMHHRGEFKLKNQLLHHQCVTSDSHQGIGGASTSHQEMNSVSPEVNFIIAADLRG
jgi:hypothetical protein